MVQLPTFSSWCWNFLCSFPKSGIALTCDRLDDGFTELVELVSTFCGCVCVCSVPMSAVYKKKHKKQPINSMNGKKYFVLWFCIKIWAINWHSNHIEDLKQSHWAQGSGVHSRALFSHFQVLLSMQTERPRDKADWACWLAQGGGGVILQVH